MGFDSGSIAFRRFAVVGAGPKEIDQDVLDKLAENTLKVGELGVPEPVEYGWSGGRHVLDDTFSFDNNVFNDSLHFGLRVDTNKVPHEIAKAYKIIEEDAAKKENPSGFISKNQKRVAKDIAQQQIDEELRRGKYRRSKLLPILWDIPGAMLYCNPAAKTEEMLLELFDRTFGLTLEPLTSGSTALRILEAAGRRREYEDAIPSRFAIGPDGEHQAAEYPWVAKGEQAKNFMGNEFLQWLWHQSFIHEGAVKTDAGELVVFFDRMLDLDCVFGQTGRDLLRADGVTRMPEAIEAIRSGKVPRKVGLILQAQGSQFSFNINAETLAVSTLKLPEIPDADNPRVLFEERITLLRDFCKVMESMFAAFLRVRATSGWDSHVTAIRKWIVQSARREVVTA